MVITVSDILRLLDDDIGYTTVMTVMSRLVEKGELIREKKWRLFEYRIKEVVVGSELSFFDRQA